MFICSFTSSSLAGTQGKDHCNKTTPEAVDSITPSGYWYRCQRIHARGTIEKRHWSKLGKYQHINTARIYFVRVQSGKEWKKGRQRAALAISSSALMCCCRLIAHRSFWRCARWNLFIHVYMDKCHHWLVSIHEYSNAILAHFSRLFSAGFEAVTTPQPPSPSSLLPLPLSFLLFSFLFPFLLFFLLFYYCVISTKKLPWWATLRWIWLFNSVAATESK